MNKHEQHANAIKSIQKKLLGKKLNYQEIYNLMDEIGNKRLSDVLTTYFVAAAFKEGFSVEELYHLTKAMVETGTKLHFKSIVADKHSTGGLAGTRTTMIVVPIVASAGFKIPKTSSRAITSPAGTADVMEVLAKVTFTSKEIETIVNKIGGCIVWGGHLGIAPADDVLIRVEEPLSFESFDKIIVSIMAKKVAIGANHLVLDIPVGKTIKIRHFADAEKVADKFKLLGKKFGIETITDINEALEPAGHGVGPALEARDVLAVLKQRPGRPLKLESKALRLAGKLLNICYKDSKIFPTKNGEDEAKKILVSGQALNKFREIVKTQKGDLNLVDAEKFEMKSLKKEIKIKHSGKIKEINNYNLNMISRILGAPGDKYAGIYLLKKIDENFEKNEPVMIFYANDRYRLEEAEETLKNFPIYLI